MNHFILRWEPFTIQIEGEFTKDNGKVIPFTIKEKYQFKREKNVKRSYIIASLIILFGTITSWPAWQKFTGAKEKNAHHVNPLFPAPPVRPIDSFRSLSQKANSYQSVRSCDDNQADGSLLLHRSIRDDRRLKGDFLLRNLAKSHDIADRNGAPL